MIIDISHRLSLPAANGMRAVEHVLLTPLSGPGQTVKDWTIEMPGIEAAARFTDAYGNRALLVSQARLDETLEIFVSGEVETHNLNGVLGRVAGEPVVGLYRRQTALTAPDARILDGFAEADRQGAGRIGLLHAVMQRIGEIYRFGMVTLPAQMQADGAQSQSQKGAEAGETADAATFAHAFIGTVRALGVPARYVTGYLASDDGRPSTFHAWAEAYDDGLGWIGFDAALGLCPTDRHVRIAAGLDGLAAQAVRMVPAAEVEQLAIAVSAQ